MSESREVPQPVRVDSAYKLVEPGTWAQNMKEQAEELFSGAVEMHEPSDLTVRLLADTWIDKLPNLTMNEAEKVFQGLEPLRASEAEREVKVATTEVLIVHPHRIFMGIVADPVLVEERRTFIELLRPDPQQRRSDYKFYFNVELGKLIDGRRDREVADTLTSKKYRPKSVKLGHTALMVTISGKPVDLLVDPSEI